MPLSKLFHKRSSQKKKKNVSDSVDSGSQSQVIENRSEKVNLSEEAEDNRQVIGQKDIVGESLAILTETVENDVSASANDTEVSRNRTRSESEGGTGLNLKPARYTKRKFGSESEVIENYAKEEGFRERLIQLKEKELEEVIGRYVNKLVRESIVSAVRNVNVESIYEELVERASDRSHSESSDISEEMLTNETLVQRSEMEDLETEGRDHSAILKGIEASIDLYCKTDDEKPSNVDGYSADCEDSESLYSTALDSKVYKTDAQDHIDKPSSLEDQLPSENGKTLNVSSEEAPNEIGQVKESKESSNYCADTDLSSHALASKEQPSEEKESMSNSFNLMTLSLDSESPLMTLKDNAGSETLNTEADLGDNLPEQHSQEEEKKVNWKMGYLQVKVPHKSRGKGHLKVWKKRCVAIQPDEFVNDPKNPCLMISVYSAESGTSRKHSALFWKSVSCNKAIVYRSSSRTHKYAFTISDDNTAVIHLAADSEAASQEWMAAIRAILWPPSPVMQLEKMLNGSEFEISIIDNEFSYRAGLLGMYGYLTITPKKLILVHPQQGYVIQEWYLNTVDKFQIMHQTRIEDVHKVLSMTTCSDSSTGKGDILIFCNEAVALLQSLASTIHKVLTHHSKQEGGKYKKELEEMADWLVPPLPQGTGSDTLTEDYYKVPPRQVKSLLDIPNFIFEKPLTPVASVAGTTSAMSSEVFEPTLETSRTNPATASHDSGISSGTTADEFLNCSVTSFVVGGGSFPGKSSDSDLSDAYTPPRTPETQKKIRKEDTGARPSCLEA